MNKTKKINRGILIAIITVCVISFAFVVSVEPVEKSGHESAADTLENILIVGQKGNSSSKIIQ